MYICICVYIYIYIYIYKSTFEARVPSYSAFTQK